MNNLPDGVTQADIDRELGVAESEFAPIEIDGARWEECAGCGAMLRLVRRDKLWFQPSHNCEDYKEEA